MKYTIILTGLLWANIIEAQQKGLSPYHQTFQGPLKLWLSTFGDCSLSGFSIKDTLYFENVENKNFNAYQNFLSIYKPLLNYNLNGSAFVDIYSYQLNLVKKKNVYYANPSHEQAVFVCIPENKYWNRIYFTSADMWIEDVAWVSDTKFILAGAALCDDNKRSPVVFLCDIIAKTMLRYFTTDAGCCMSSHQYKSPLHKNIFIKGL